MHNNLFSKASTNIGINSFYSLQENGQSCLQCFTKILNLDKSCCNLQADNYNQYKGGDYLVGVLGAALKQTMR